MANSQFFCLFWTFLFLLHYISNSVESTSIRRPRNQSENNTYAQRFERKSATPLKNLVDRKREVPQRMRSNRTRIRMIEKAFFFAFRNCQLSDVTDFVLLDVKSRKDRKNCVIANLRKMESIPGEYTRYLNVATDIRNSEILQERLNTHRDVMTQSKRTERPDEKEDIEKKGDYVTEKIKVEIYEKPERRMGKEREEKPDEEVKEAGGIEQIKQIPEFPYIKLGDDGNNGNETRGIILYMNFTVPDGDSFPISDSAVIISQIFKSLPHTMKYILQEIKKRSKTKPHEYFSA